MTTAECIFCGRDGPLTNAHVFRKEWIEQLYPTMARFRHHRQAHLPGHAGSSTWTVPTADLKVKDVCERCNAGWMNRLDHDAESVFATRAAIGLDVKVVAMADKNTLARWCSLIAVLLDRLSAEPRMSGGAHEAVYRGDVPDGAHVWLVRTDPLAEGQPHAFSSAKDLELADGQGAAFFITFGVGQLVVQVYMPTDQTVDGVELRRVVDHALVRQLWPDPIVPLVWPPPKSLPGADLAAFCDHFRRFHPLN